MEDLTLEELFDKSSRLYDAVVVQQSRTGDEVVGEAIAVIETCLRRSSAEGLFSANEELDEVSTGTLKYLFLPYYLGKVHSQFVQLSGREGHLKLSRELFLDYLDRCKALRGVLHEDEEAALDVILGTAADDDEDGSGGGGGGGRGKPLSAADQRARKIAKFRRDKEAQERMKTLQEALLVVESRRRRRAEARSAERDGDGDGTGDGAGDGDGEGDHEEQTRELRLLQLQHFARDCLDELPLLAQELAMLAHMSVLRQQQQQQPQQQQPSSSSSSASSYLPPLPAQPAPENRPGLSVTRTSLAPDGSLVLTRETIKAHVFTPAMAAPTVTLEQFADSEVAAALAREEAQAQAAAARRGGGSGGEGGKGGDPSRRYDQLLLDGDEDDAEAVDRAAANDRAWDDWKEDNRKGSGNKAGKRF